MNTQELIEKLEALYRAANTYSNDSKYPGLSYEDGIFDTIDAAIDLIASGDSSTCDDLISEFEL